jgi:RNA polymerase sigma-70 factor (ECF subfamily)
MSQNPLPIPSESGSVPDTAALLPAIAAGNREAFRCLHREWAHRLYQAVLRILRDPAQTEEVVQEIFLEVWMRADRFHPGSGSASGFLLRLARSRAIDRVRASQTHRDRTVLAGTHDYYARTDALSRVHDDWAVAYDLRQSLTGLTVLQREVVELVYFQSLSHTEAADYLGVPVGTVKSRVFSALTSLRREHLHAAA